jgi:hypothetical protein
MVTAILPSLTDESEPAADAPRKPTHNARVSIAWSVESEATITPERYRTSENHDTIGPEERIVRPSGSEKPSVLAGYVGLFTGCGALVALSLFLPLPTHFGQIEGVTVGEAVTYSFYVVGAVSFLVAIFVFFGLRGLKGEDGKGWRMLLGLRDAAPDGSGSQASPAPKQVRLAIRSCIARHIC